MGEIESSLRSFFEKKENIAMAFLFGSAASRRMMAESDVDVAVWFSKEYNLDDVNQLQDEVERLLHKNVDLIVLNQARPTVAWAAMRGKRLLIRDEPLFYKKVLEISTEAEDMQDFKIDLWKLKQAAGKEND